MAFPTAVNPQITDAVTQTNVKVVGQAPAAAIGLIYQSMARSTGILVSECSLCTTAEYVGAAATHQGLMQTYVDETAASAADVPKLARGDSADNLKSLLTVLKSFNTAK
ncbi:RebB family R body protein [Xanthomonas vasicola]|uniref:R body protein RebB-like protein n=1 Tax=Xanthomonas vasicola TaxID=56459 RepID=A0ABD7S6R0_XANVA|nr:RebB family R body protein [Xanthomonas vasicola]AZR22196.1 R body protein RebB-like protein [Xanthomonas vasicola]KGR43323.1 R body protein RebB-like protein [Xanthomonas vasicola]KGR48000.1 R body protein RebB-like protein [Xanthomonas vasicola]KGR61731.1 R body protein RebB-like protein [Xanthomonas vasicola]MDO6986346.1 RebB family R body protein [Xanthomonas vasicola]